VFAGYGLQGIVDQKSRDPESLARSFAGSLKALSNVKHAPSCDAILVVSPEHHRTFKNAGWPKARLYEELYRLCEIPGADLAARAEDIAEGGPPALTGRTVNKFRPGGIMIVRGSGIWLAGGTSAKFVASVTSAKFVVSPKSAKIAVSRAEISYRVPR